MAVGGAAGYSAAKYGLDQMAGSIKDVGMFFGTHIAPWLMAAMAVIVPVTCIAVYRSAKKLLGTWDGEDEDISDAIDRKLSTAIWISSVSLVFSYFLISASYSGGFATFDSKERTVLFFCRYCSFLCCYD